MKDEVSQAKFQKSIKKLYKNIDLLKRLQTLLDFEKIHFITKKDLSYFDEKSQKESTKAGEILYQPPLLNIHI